MIIPLAGIEAEDSLYPSGSFSAALRCRMSRPGHFLLFVLRSLNGLVVVNIYQVRFSLLSLLMHLLITIVFSQAQKSIQVYEPMFLKQSVKASWSISSASSLLLTMRYAALNMALEYSFIDPELGFPAAPAALLYEGIMNMHIRYSKLG